MHKIVIYIILSTAIYSLQTPLHSVWSQHAEYSQWDFKNGNFVKYSPLCSDEENYIKPFTEGLPCSE